MTLPNAQTNRYGDLLVEFYRGMKDGNLSDVRLDEIQRNFNELWERENKYKQFLRFQDNKIASTFLDLPFNVIYSSEFENSKSNLVIPIPALYKHLVIMGSGRTTGAGTSTDFLFARFNGDAGANYANQRHIALNAAIIASRDTGQNQGFVGILTQGGRAAGDVSTFFSVIPNYSSATLNKNTLVMSSPDFGGTYSLASNWDSIAPITSIEFLPGADDIAEGTVISVYGIQ